MYYNNHFIKLSVLHKLGLRVVLGICSVMKMINVHEGKRESGDRQCKGEIIENTR